MRVDVFPNGGECVVAEVALTPGHLGEKNIRWGHLDLWMVEMLGKRWLDGYGEAKGQIGP